MRIVRNGFVIAGLLANGAAYAGVPGWSVSESSGQVMIASTGLVKAAVRGGGLTAGDVVSTGRNGRAVLVRGEEYLVVAPNSRLRVADPVKSGGMTQIIENFGNVIFKIKKMTMPHFAVETPFLAAVVKGTTFSVTVTDKGASVQVIEGRVAVATRDGGASYLVLPGDIGSVSASAPGRLDVQGHETKSIDSPTPAAAAAAVSVSVSDIASDAAATKAGVAQFAGAIAVPVGEGAVNLGAMSDGMVTGDSSMTAMVATTAPGTQKPPVPVTSAANVAPLTDPRTLMAAAETVESLPPSPAPVLVESLPPSPAPELVASLPPSPAPELVASLPPSPAPELVEALPPSPAPVLVETLLPSPAPFQVAAVPVAAVAVAAVTGPAPVINTGGVAPVGNSNNGNGKSGGNSGSGNNGNGNGNGFAFGGNGNNGNGNGNGKNGPGNNGNNGNNGSNGHKN